MSDEEPIPSEDGSKEEDPGARRAKSFLGFVFHFFRYPSDSWEQLSEDRSPKESEFLRYYLPAVLLLVSGTVGGYITFGVNIPFSDPITSELKIVHVYLDSAAIVVQHIIFGFFYLLLPFVLAKPFSYLTKLFLRVEERDGVKVGTVTDARRFLILSSVPVFTASAFQGIPPLSLFSLLLCLYGLVIYYKGIEPMMGIARKSVFFYFCSSLILIFFYTTVITLFSDELAGSPLREAIEKVSAGNLPDSVE